MYHFNNFCLKGSHTAMFAYQKVSIFDIERTLRGLVYQHNFIGGSNLTSFAYTIQKAPSPENPAKGVYNSWIVYWLSSLKGYIGATILLYLYAQRGLVVIQQTF